MMKVSCHSCPSWRECAQTNNTNIQIQFQLSWKECAQTKVKLAQAQYIKSRTYTAHFWTEFAINEIIQVLEASQFFVVVYSAAHQMQSVKRQNHKLSEVKIFFVHMGKGLTHHRLHNHITKNIFTTATFEHHSKIIKIL